MCIRDSTKGVGVVLRGLAKQGVEPTVYVDDAVRAASKEIESVEDACDLRALPIGGMLSVAGMAVHVFGTSHDAASVSYTHLDVYKRQVCASSLPWSSSSRKSMGSRARSVSYTHLVR